MFFLLLLLFLFSFILCFIWSHLFFGLHTAQQSVRTLKQPVTLYLPYHCGYKVLCWVISTYIGQRTKGVFRRREREGRGVSLLVVETLGKEDYVLSAVRLHRREIRNTLPFSSQSYIIFQDKLTVAWYRRGRTTGKGFYWWQHREGSRLLDSLLDFLRLMPCSLQDFMSCI